MEYRFHPLAEMFPAMSDAELAELAKDIEQNGQLHPIRVIGDQIIDGCNRYRACQIAGVEPVVEEYEGSTDEEILIRYVMSCNISRRQLTSSQRAMLAVELLPRLEAAARERQRAAGVFGAEGGRGHKKEETLIEIIQEGFSEENGEQGEVGEKEDPHEKPNPTSIEKAAEITGTNSRYVAFGKEIEEKSPGLAAVVKSGVKTIPAAIKEIRDEEKKAKQAEVSDEGEKKKEPPKLLVTIPKKGTSIQEFIQLAANIDNDESLPEEIPVVFVNGKELGYELSGAGA